LGRRNGRGNGRSRFRTSHGAARTAGFRLPAEEHGVNTVEVVSLPRRGVSEYPTWIAFSLFFRASAPQRHRRVVV